MDFMDGRCVSLQSQKILQDSVKSCIKFISWSFLKLCGNLLSGLMVGSRGVGVVGFGGGRVGSRGDGGPGCGISECHSIDRLTKLWLLHWCFFSLQNCLGMDNETLKPYEVALLETAKDGNHRVMRELLNAGTYPGPPDFDGWTPLMFSAESGHTECVRLLLEFGADPDLNLAYNESRSFLELAASNGHEGCVLLLLQAGAETDDALIMAVGNDFVQCTKFLLKDTSREGLAGIRRYVKSNEMWKVVAAAGADVFYRVRRNGVPSLKNACRKVIRRRLMIVGDSQNLFHKFHSSVSQVLCRTIFSMMSNWTKSPFN